MSSMAIAQPIVHSPTSIQERFILTQVGTRVLVFPAPWVAEIFRVPRSHVLDLPFYQAPLMGVTYHNSQIIPLASSHAVLQMEENNLREMLPILQLSHEVGLLANMGIMVDKALGSSSREQLPSSLFSAQAPDPQDPHSQNIESQDMESMVLFQPEWFPKDLWYPQG